VKIIATIRGRLPSTDIILWGYGWMRKAFPSAIMLKREAAHQFAGNSVPRRDGPELSPGGFSALTCSLALVV
jgi:hypothetical protein